MGVLVKFNGFAGEIEIKKTIDCDNENDFNELFFNFNKDMIFFHNQKTDESKVFVLQSTIIKKLLLEKLLHKFQTNFFCVHLVNLRKIFLHLL